jgi:uncharacterized membrane protein SpoIIM required for sporulation
VIVDLEKFLATEQPFWKDLERVLTRVEDEPNWHMDLAELKRFHYLYERASADLGKLATFASEPETRRYLESLVARAYGEIHESREKAHRFDLVAFLFRTFPQTFRRHIRAFWLSVTVTIAGCMFGGLALLLDPDSKPAIMPFEHLLGDPSERVAREEHSTRDRLANMHGYFSAGLMTHNTQVSIFTLALGATWGVGTVLMLFYNGVILGAVSVDYIRAGHAQFLAGWLLPHGSFEIPAILIAGQGGFILGRALIGWGRRASVKTRLRAISGDLVTLICGVTVLLIWAGFVESFFSQYHEPALPYSFKIAFGLVELALLGWWLAKSGASPAPAGKPADTL